MKPILVTMLLLIVSVAFAQPDVEWTHTYGSAANEQARCVIQTADGGYAFVGTTRDTQYGDPDIWLVKVDADGSEQWSTTFGGDLREAGMGLCAAPDGGYVLTGYTTSLGSGWRDLWVIKTDANGTLVWEYLDGTFENDEGWCVIPVSAGGYAVAGYTETGSNDTWFQATLHRLSEDGDLLWSQEFGEDQEEWGESVVETPDGNFILAGTTGSFTGNRDAYLVGVDPDGYELWETYRHIGNSDWGHAACLTHDGTGVFVAGQADQHNSDLYQAFAARADLDGTWTWNFRYGMTTFYDYARTVCALADGGCIISGITKDYTTDKNDMLLVRVDANGYTVWRTQIGEADVVEWAFDMKPTADGGHIIAGYTDSGEGGYDACLIKLAEEINSVPEGEEQVPDRHGLLRAYPNPFNGEVKLTFKLERPGEVAVNLINAEGQQVYHDALTLTGGEQLYSLNADGLASGTYLCQLTTGSWQAATRVVLVK